MDPAKRQPRGEHHDAYRAIDSVAVGHLMEQLGGEGIADVGECHVSQAHAPDPLDAHHPRAGLGQAHGECPYDEEEGPQAKVEAVDRTGVEMEAMTACAIAALTVYDMCKTTDRTMSIGQLMLWEKAGGSSGVWKRDPLA